MSEIICKIDFSTKTVVEEFNTINHIVFKYANISGVKNQILLCLNNTIKVFDGFGWICKSRLDKIGIENYIFNDKIAEWDFEHNIGIDINTIRYGSRTKIWWKRFKHLSYFTKISHKTIDSSKCKECVHDSQRKFNKEEKEEHIKQHIEKRKNNQVIDSVFIGDNTEIYIENLLKNSKEFYIIDRIGNTGD
jgi:hypothetical protein